MKASDLKRAETLLERYQSQIHILKALENALTSDKRPSVFIETPSGDRRVYPNTQNKGVLKLLIMDHKLQIEETRSVAKRIGLALED